MNTFSKLALVSSASATLIAMIGLTGLIGEESNTAWLLALICIILALILWVLGRKPSV